MNIIKHENIPDKFWNEWLDSDTKKRLSLLSKTMIVREFSDHLMAKFTKAKLKKSYIKELAVRHFNDYLQDLENAMLTRKSLR